jgi:hypothetical protein
MCPCVTLGEKITLPNNSSRREKPVANDLKVTHLVVAPAAGSKGNLFPKSKVTKIKCATTAEQI